MYQIPYPHLNKYKTLVHSVINFPTCVMKEKALSWKFKAKYCGQSPKPIQTLPRPARSTDKTINA